MELFFNYNRETYSAICGSDILSMKRTDHGENLYDALQECNEMMTKKHGAKWFQGGVQDYSLNLIAMDFFVYYFYSISPGYKLDKKREYLFSLPNVHDSTIYNDSVFHNFPCHVSEIQPEQLKRLRELDNSNGYPMFFLVLDKKGQTIATLFEDNYGTVCVESVYLYPEVWQGLIEFLHSYGLLTAEESQKLT